MKKLLMLVVLSVAGLQASESSSSSSGLSPKHGLFGRGRWRNATEEQIAERQQKRATKMAKWQNATPEEREQMKANMKEKFASFRKSTPEEKTAKLKAAGFSDEQINSYKQIKDHLKANRANCKGGQCKKRFDWKNATEEQKEAKRATMREKLIARGVSPEEADAKIAARKAKWAGIKSARTENEMMMQG